MKRKKRIDIGQNWVAWGPRSDVNHFFQIVARISDGCWMYNHRRASRYFFVAVQRMANLQTVIFDEYGEEVGGAGFSLVKKSSSKVTWLKEVSW